MIAAFRPIRDAIAEAAEAGYWSGFREGFMTALLLVVAVGVVVLVVREVRK